MGYESVHHSHSQPKHTALHFIDEESESDTRSHLIVLFSKVMKLSKNWYTAKILRYKNHYEIVLNTYSGPSVENTLKLPELIGTALLSQLDYDYSFIFNNCVKFTHQFICLSFDLGQEKKKHFYRFEKKTLKG